MSITYSTTLKSMTFYPINSHILLWRYPFRKWENMLHLQLAKQLIGFASYIWWSLNLSKPVEPPENQHVFKISGASILKGHSTDIALANNKSKWHHRTSTKTCIQSFPFSLLQSMIFSPVCSKGIEPADSAGQPDFLSTKSNKDLNIKKAYNCLLPKENEVWHVLYENIAIAIV